MAQARGQHVGGDYPLPTHAKPKQTRSFVDGATDGATEYPVKDDQRWAWKASPRGQQVRRSLRTTIPGTQMRRTFRRSVGSSSGSGGDESVSPLRPNVLRFDGIKSEESDKTLARENIGQKSLTDLSTMCSMSSESERSRARSASIRKNGIPRVKMDHVRMLGASPRVESTWRSTQNLRRARDAEATAMSMQLACAEEMRVASENKRAAAQSVEEAEVSMHMLRCNMKAEGILMMTHVVELDEEIREEHRMLEVFKEEAAASAKTANDCIVSEEESRHQVVLLEKVSISLCEEASCLRAELSNAAAEASALQVKGEETARLTEMLHEERQCTEATREELALAEVELMRSDEVITELRVELSDSKRLSQELRMGTEDISRELRATRRHAETLAETLGNEREEEQATLQKIKVVQAASIDLGEEVKMLRNEMFDAILANGREFTPVENRSWNHIEEVALELSHLRMHGEKVASELSAARQRSELLTDTLREERQNEEAMRQQLALAEAASICRGEEVQELRSELRNVASATGQRLETLKSELREGHEDAEVTKQKLADVESASSDRWEEALALKAELAEESHAKNLGQAAQELALRNEEILAQELSISRVEAEEATRELSGAWERLEATADLLCQHRRDTDATCEGADKMRVEISNLRHLNELQLCDALRSETAAMLQAEEFGNSLGVVKRREAAGLVELSEAKQRNEALRRDLDRAHRQRSKAGSSARRRAATNLLTNMVARQHAVTLFQEMMADRRACERGEVGASPYFGKEPVPPWADMDHRSVAAAEAEAEGDNMACCNVS
eukprot:TRINITY_DN51558_c0_g1_i1.p1 TRINITY_DN51558_c0_g1~~TRINITY_DN51558_c0_g1_i1.p1  ORF type:complete len:803 (+),score=177.72 TRINITY_DN51558_c0_g1_i1:110-2518(+)